MRLLERLRFGEYRLTENLLDDAIPLYAILSHTWGKEESINSMFRWYQKAVTCYVFMSDVSIDGKPRGCKGSRSELMCEFTKSRWFTRGWTLQELISPKEVVFFDKAWERMGNRKTLADAIAMATGIPDEAYTALNSFSVAQKMSWASRRKTSKEEDIAYSLLGIFSINMPLLYGEGPRAFVRLQEEIIKRTEDETIYIWSADDKSKEQSTIAEVKEQISNGFPCFTRLGYSVFPIQPSEDTGSGRLFAPGPSCFADCGQIERDLFFLRAPTTLTNRGLEICTLLFKHPEDPDIFMVPLNCKGKCKMPLGLALIKLFDYWVRVGFAVMPGKRGKLFWKMQMDQTAAELIYISAQWPTHVYVTMEDLFGLTGRQPIRFERR